MKSLNILTWHIHGSYLYYLTQMPHTFYVPVKELKYSGYFGRTSGFPWGSNVIEISAEEVQNLDLDFIIFQSNYSPSNPDNDYLKDQMDILSEYQKKVVPKVFIEHDPPRKNPTDTRHLLYDSEIPVVHVTHFNQLMWDNGTTPTYVIDHGVMVPDDVMYTGEIERGIVVINGLYKRGRRLGLDIFEKVRKEIPLDLVGMDAEKLGGRGEVSHHDLPYFIAKYRFFFNPIRYTSLGLSVCESMIAGVPVVSLATTEMSMTIDNNITGFINTNVDILIEKMKLLLHDKTLAKKLGYNAKIYAKKRFNIKRFVDDWEKVIDTIMKKSL